MKLGGSRREQKEGERKTAQIKQQVICGTAHKREEHRIIPLEASAAMTFTGSDELAMQYRIYYTTKLPNSVSLWKIYTKLWWCFNFIGFLLIASPFIVWIGKSPAAVIFQTWREQRKCFKISVFRGKKTWHRGDKWCNGHVRDDTRQHESPWTMETWQCLFWWNKISLHEVKSDKVYFVVTIYSTM